MEKRAMEIYNECPRLFKKKKITVSELAKKIKYAESTCAQYLGILVEKGILKKEGRGKTKYWTPVTEGIEDKKTTYEPIIDTLPKSEPKKELPKPMSKLDKLKEDTAEHQKTIDELKTAKLLLIARSKAIEQYKEENEGLKTKLSDHANEHRKHTDTLLNEIDELKLKIEGMEVIKKNTIDSITPEDLMELNKIGIMAEPMPLRSLSPEDRITEVVDIAYSGAESIQINPENHEVIIKMKG
jgi:Fic family protein